MFCNGRRIRPTECPFGVDKMTGSAVSYRSFSGRSKRTRQIPLRVVIPILLLCLGLMIILVVIIYSDRKHEEGDETTDAFDSLKTSVDEIPSGNKRNFALHEKITFSKDNLMGYLQSNENNDTVHQFTSTLASLPPALDAFSSIDPELILSGSLEIITAFSKLLKLAGTIGERGEIVVRLISSVFNGILGLFGEGGKDISEVVQYVIKEALDEYHEHELQVEAAGVGESYATARVFLDGLRVQNTTLGQQEVSAIYSNVPITLGIEFIGKLEAEIDASCYQSAGHQPSDGLQTAQSCVRYCRLYYQLVMLEVLVRMDEYSLVKAAGHNDDIGDAIWAVVVRRMEKVKSVLGFLHEPEYDTILPAVLFDQKNDTAMKKFMNFCEIPDPVRLPGLENRWVSLITPNSMSGSLLQFLDQRDSRCDSAPTRSEGSKANVSNDVIKFGRVDLNLWTLQVKTDGKSSNTHKFLAFLHRLGGHRHQDLHDQWYLTVDGHKAGLLSTRETAECGTYCSHFTVIKLKSNGPYMIASRKWPENFLYISSNGCLLNSASGDPGPSGHFQIKNMDPDD